MAPLPNVDPLPLLLPISRRQTLPVGAYGDTSWPGAISVASVDLMAMVVSDAGLASTEPEWWNCSPIGCMLIALQPRGGWQVMQRAVQWGNDSFARSFGVNCKQPVLYCYFACSLRNRLEVWDSDKFISPQVGVDDEEHVPLVSVNTETIALEDEDEEDGICETSPETVNRRSIEKKEVRVEATEKPEEKKTPTGWKAIRLKMGHFTFRGSRGKINEEPAEKKPAEKKSSVGWKAFKFKTGPFTVRRPTKLTDGSRGGQAFICSILRPDEGHAYGIDQQAHVQFLSILLIIAAVAKSDDPIVVRRLLEEEFDLTPKLGSIFKRLAFGLCVAEFAVLGFVVSVFYALWGSNIYGRGAPYALQVCSLCSWSFGASGLLMIGGNPRVTIGERKTIPKQIEQRLSSLSDHVKIHFGSLHGSIFTSDRGSCYIGKDVLRSICHMELNLVRGWKWRMLLVWFALHILISVTIQVMGARVATIQSQVLGIAILVLTSVVRGQGISGPEEWMIPSWKMRKGGGYAVALQGRFAARSK